MLIDHKRKVAMVAVPKTGSTSLHHAVGRALGRVWQFRAPAPVLYHMTASDIRMILGPGRWRRYATFSVVRNPFDRAVSLFHDFSGRGLVKSSDFARFAAEELGPLSGRDVHFRPQAHFLTDLEGASIVKSVRRFEDGLEEALDEICAAAGVPRPERLGHARRSDRAEASAYYDDPAAAEAVRAVYAADFDLLGYPSQPPVVA